MKLKVGQVFNIDKDTWFEDDTYRHHYARKGEKVAIIKYKDSRLKICILDRRLKIKYTKCTMKFDHFTYLIKYEYLKLNILQTAKNVLK